jgi:AcrR family transcriptional regulator
MIITLASSKGGVGKSTPPTAKVWSRNEDFLFREQHPPATTRRARILRAALKAFTENGYAGTSTLQVATRAKVSKRDLYANFANKQAMLVSCVKTRLEKMRMPTGLPPPATREAVNSRLRRN